MMREGTKVKKEEKEKIWVKNKYHFLSETLKNMMIPTACTLTTATYTRRVRMVEETLHLEILF